MLCIFYSVSIQSDHEQPVEQLEMFYFNAKINHKLYINCSVHFANFEKVIVTKMCGVRASAFFL